MNDEQLIILLGLLFGGSGIVTLIVNALVDVFRQRQEAALAQRLNAQTFLQEQGEQRILEQEKRVIELTSRLAAAEQRATETAAARTDLMQQIEAMRVVQEGRTKEIAGLQQRLSETERNLIKQIDAKERELVNLRKMLDDLTMKVAKLEHDNEGYKSMLNENERTIQQLEARAAAAEAERDALKVRLAEVEAERDALARQLMDTRPLDAITTEGGDAPPSA